MSLRFGNYDLLEKIAVGGMAEIFLARSVHSKGIEKRMVIKRIHPTLANDKSFVAMFIDEARLGVSMVHGNIVPVFDFGYIDGYYFLAMEYVVGQNLAELHARTRIVEMPWPTELAIYTTMEILEGLDYAHKKRDDQGRPLELVHRDVSPSNILISNDGQVKLLDFGIARSQAREYETRTGVIKGKPGYMSPEQAAGQDVDARADVWSASSVLYELIHGTKLKDGREKGRDSELEKILSTALAADRDQRYDSARELQNALANHLASLGLRPTSSDLTEFIHKVSAAEAPGENWDLRSDSMEKHVAKALAQEIAANGKTPAKKNPQPEPLPEGAQTKRLPKAPPTTEKPQSSEQQLPRTPAEGSQISRSLMTGPNQRKSFAVPAVTAVLFLGALLAFAWFSTRTNDPATGSAPQEVQEERKGDTPQTTPSPPPQTASLSVRIPLAIRSRPAGANLQLNGKNTGQTTPAELQLTPGEYHITLTSPGFEKWEKDVLVKEEDQTPVEVTLIPRQGAFTVETEPKGAHVEIDGVAQGRSPITVSDVPPGKHRITARLKGRKAVRRIVNIPATGDHRVRLILSQNKPSKTAPASAQNSYLSINTVPWTNVSLDGKMIGTTPIINREVPAGPHSIILTNPVRDLSKRIDIHLDPGEKKRIREILRQKSVDK